jgi:hypothetical protein
VAAVHNLFLGMTHEKEGHVELTTTTTLAAMNEEASSMRMTASSCQPLLLASSNNNNNNKNSSSLVAERDCLLSSDTDAHHHHRRPRHHHPLEQEADEEEGDHGLTSLASLVRHRVNESESSSRTLSLSWPLRILFSLNGLSLSLPTTALMYIINTRVALSLSLLPTYGAISVLPWSLKPLYAMALSSSTSSTSTSTTPGRGAQQKQYVCFSYCCSCCLPSQRHLLISILLLASAVTTIATAWIPSGNGSSRAVMWLFVLGFLRGVAGAWPEFLLGLALLQQATDNSTSTATTTHAATATPTSAAIIITYEECVAKFQAQAATARNVGSLVANMLASSLFVYWKRRDQQKKNNDSSDFVLNDWTVLVLFSLSGLFICMGAVIAFLYRVGSTHDQRVVAGALSTSESSAAASQSSFNRRAKPRQRRLLLQSSSSSSSSSLYQSCDVDADDNDDSGGVEVEPQQQADIPYQDTTQQSSSSNRPTTNSSSLAEAHSNSNQDSCPQQVNHTSSNNIRIVLLIQLGAILMTIRQPIINGTRTPWLWTMLIIACSVALAVSVRVAMTSTTSTVTTHHGSNQHLVGLFLLLRNVLPDAGFLMYSFVYDVVGRSSPLLLQFFSLSDMVIVTLSSWSYGVLFASMTSSSSSSSSTSKEAEATAAAETASSTSPLSSSQDTLPNSNHDGGISTKFKRLIMSMTILASVASLANLVIVHLWQSNENDENSNNNNRWILTVAVTFLCNALMTWTSEWSFLPDVILASVSVSHCGTRSTSSTTATTATTTGPQQEGDDDDNHNTEELASSAVGHSAAVELKEGPSVLAATRASSPHGNANNDIFMDEHNIDSDESGTSVDGSSEEKARQHQQQQQQQIGIEYGSFISCIDFGDQLGALVMGWIVGAMNITRENDWHHLDDLIILCAVSAAVGTVVLVRVLL